MFKVIILLLFVISISYIPPVHSALITHYGYTLDTDTKIIDGGGLEWLQWDVTIGKSIQWANNGFDSIFTDSYGDDWVVASNTQISSLFKAFFPSVLWDTSEDSFQSLVSGYSPLPSNGIETNEADIKFISIFGDSHQAAGDGTNLFGDPQSKSHVYFGTDADSDNLYNIANVLEDYTTSHPINVPSRVFLFDDRWSDTETHPSIGIALVRASSQVPEPSTLTIFALGLMGLLSRRIKKQF